MLSRIDARMCTAYIEDGVIYAGFASQADEPGEYLLLQRAVSPDPQDRALGHDCVHVSCCDQSRACYGGIRRFVLEPGRAMIHLDQTAAGRLGTARHLAIRFPADAALLVTLSDHLRRIFAGDDGVFSCSLAPPSGHPDA